MTSGRPSVPRSVAGWGTAAVAFVARHSVLLALAVLAVVGLAVLDDYGVLWDGDREYRNGVAWNVGSQRGRGQAAIAYALGDTETLRDTGPLHNRYYGVVFEVPLVLVERLLGLTDSRAIYLSRHLLTHLCFLAGGGGAAWLASRLFGSRWLALLALGLFVLHPRLYAHSFFNAKDIPFLVAFLGCLALIHRAWQRGGGGVCAVWGGGGGRNELTHHGRGIVCGGGGDAGGGLGAGGESGGAAAGGEDAGGVRAGQCLDAVCGLALSVGQSLGVA